VNKSGEVVGHRTKRHPATSIAKEAQAAMLKASALFGFDPSSRSCLSVGEPTTEDPFAAFVAKMSKKETDNISALN
jgi:phage terminase small subunit